MTEAETCAELLGWTFEPIARLVDREAERFGYRDPFWLPATRNTVKGSGADRLVVADMRILIAAARRAI